MKSTLIASKTSLYNLVSYFLEKNEIYTKLNKMKDFEFRKSSGKNFFKLYGSLMDQTSIEAVYSAWDTPYLDITLKGLYGSHKNIVVTFRTIEENKILVKYKMIKFGSKEEHEEFVKKYFSN